MVEIRRGDIFLARLDPVIGSEQGKTRPVLIIQNDTSNKFSPVTIIAPITTTKFSREYPTNLEISVEESGLREDSTILLNPIRVVDKSRLIQKAGVLSPEMMWKVDLAIKASLSLD